MASKRWSRWALSSLELKEFPYALLCVLDRNLITRQSLSKAYSQSIEMSSSVSNRISIQIYMESHAKASPVSKYANALLSTPRIHEARGL